MSETTEQKETPEQKDVDDVLEQVQGGIYDDSDSVTLDQSDIAPSDYNTR